LLNLEIAPLSGTAERRQGARAKRTGYLSGRAGRGAPLIDQNANREMFEEGVEVLFKAFEGKPFSHQGKYYTIPPEVTYRVYTLKEITPVPTPQRQPVECAAVTRARPALGAPPRRRGDGRESRAVH
jgi:hypothetical protein